MKPVSEAGTLHVACLCAAWCRACDAYAPVFSQALAQLQQQTWPGQTVRGHWIDIEDDAELLGDLDVETFPMLVIADDRQVRFAGPLTPQPATLQRVVRAALEAAANGSVAVPQAPGVEAFAERLRRLAAAPVPG